MYAIAIASFIMGIILLVIGFLTDPGVTTSQLQASLPDTEKVVNLHKLHIKQTFYYFSGVCFIISAINFGFDKLLGALDKEG
jgi:hypothetical protein